MFRLKRFQWLLVPAVVFVAGCDATTVTVSATGAATTPTVASTATAGATVPTATPALPTPPPPPPVPTVDPGVISSCFGPGIDPSTVRQIGSVVFTADIGPLAYPLVQLPPGTSLKPYKLSGTPTNNFAGSFVSGVHLDPFGKSAPYHTGLFVQICNTASRH